MDVGFASDVHVGFGRVRVGERFQVPHWHHVQVPDEEILREVVDVPRNAKLDHLGWECDGHLGKKHETRVSQAKMLDRKKLDAKGRAIQPNPITCCRYHPAISLPLFKELAYVSPYVSPKKASMLSFVTFGTTSPS